MDHCTTDAYLGDLLKLKSKQGDVTTAFLHADLGEDERVSVKMPLGFRKKGKVPKLKKTLSTIYGKVPGSSGST